MRTKKGLVAAALALAVAASLAPAHATDLVYATGPGGQSAGYTVPVLAIRMGDRVTFLNGDAAFHDVVSGSYSYNIIIGPDALWCADAGFAPGRCPLVWTPLIGLAQTAPIYGLDSLKPGDRIPYTCTIHSTMNGTLVVLPE